MSRKFSIYYGWFIVALSIISMVFIYGARHSFSVFFPPILVEFGWKRSSTALMLSLNLLVYGLTAPIAGTLCDRWKPRRIVFIGIIILSLSTSLCAFAKELWHFYVLFGVIMPIGTSFSGWPVLGPAIANWFVSRRGLAMGLGQAGGGLSFSYSIFVEYFISELGWRNAFFVVAGMLMAVVLPISFLFFYYHPEKKGLNVNGTSKFQHSEDLKEKINVEKDHFDWTLREALRTRQLWLIVISFSLFWGIGCYMILAHQVKFAQDIGFSTSFAASILGLTGILAAIGQLSFAMSDFIGRVKTSMLAVILSIIALVALMVVRNNSQAWLLYVYSICFGFGSGLFSPAIYTITADIFYGKNFGSISGVLLTGFGLGGIVGPWLGGYIHDVSGSYSIALILILICFAISGVSLLFATRGKLK